MMLCTYPGSGGLAVVEHVNHAAQGAQHLCAPCGVQRDRTLLKSIGVAPLKRVLTRGAEERGDCEILLILSYNQRKQQRLMAHNHRDTN